MRHTLRKHQPWDGWWLLSLVFTFSEGSSRNLVREASCNSESQAAPTSRAASDPWATGLKDRAGGKEQVPLRDCKSQRDATETRGNIQEPKISQKRHIKRGQLPPERTSDHCPPSHRRDRKRQGCSLQAGPRSAGAARTTEGYSSAAKALPGQCCPQEQPSTGGQGTAHLPAHGL